MTETQTKKKKYYKASTKENMQDDLQNYFELLKLNKDFK